MTSGRKDIEKLLSLVTFWASHREDVEALALVGSCARGDDQPDSDVDLLLLTSRPECYWEDETWPAAFGPVNRRAREEYGRVTSLRVWYESGREVEFGIAKPDWAALPLEAGTLAVLSAGMRILFEREALLSLARDSLPRRNASPPQTAPRC